MCWASLPAFERASDSGSQAAAAVDSGCCSHPADPVVVGAAAGVEVAVEVQVVAAVAVAECTAVAADEACVAVAAAEALDRQSSDHQSCSADCCC